MPQRTVRQHVPCAHRAEITHDDLVDEPVVVLADSVMADRHPIYRSKIAQLNHELVCLAALPEPRSLRPKEKSNAKKNRIVETSQRQKKFDGPVGDFQNKSPETRDCENSEVV